MSIKYVIFISHICVILLYLFSLYTEITEGTVRTILALYFVFCLNIFAFIVWILYISGLLFITVIVFSHSLCNMS